MYKCKYCGSEFESINSLKGHKAKCEKYQSFVISKLTESELRRWFEVEKLSAHFISKKILDDEIRAGRIIDECKKYNIKTWTVKESNNLDIAKNRRKQTCLEVYGAENCLSKGTKSYKKRNRTVKKKYGVGNVFELDTVKDKIKETCLEKYGVENFVQSDGYGQYRNVGNTSYPHKQISDMLNEIGVEHVNEKTKLWGYHNDELKRMYSPRVDIFIPSKNIVIEIYGDNWHANPKRYKPNDEIYKWGGLKKAKDIWKQDDIRKRHIEKAGTKVIIYWCSEIVTNPEKVKKSLCKLLESSQSKK